MTETLLAEKSFFFFSCAYTYILVHTLTTVHTQYVVGKQPSGIVFL